MKRKILSLALIAALVFALSVSAFAAADVESGKVDDVVQGIITSTEKVTTDKGTIDTNSTKEIAEEIVAKDFFENNEKVDTKVDEIVAQVAEAGKKIESFELKVAAAFNFFPDADMLAAVERNEIVKVTFENLKDITTADTVVVMHFNGTEWVVLNARVTANGTVEVDFDGFSPVAISKLAIVYSSEPTTPSTPNTSTTVKSPQTSDIG